MTDSKQRLSFHTLRKANLTRLKTAKVNWLIQTPTAAIGLQQSGWNVFIEDDAVKVIEP